MSSTTSTTTDTVYWGKPQLPEWVWLKIIEFLIRRNKNE